MRSSLAFHVIVGLAIVAVLDGTERNAEAFCRKTTCTESCSTDADGCPATGIPLSWPGGCVGFSLQSDGTQQLGLDEVRDAIRNSFTTWSEADCGGGTKPSLTLSELVDVKCKKSEYATDGPNVNVVLFQDDDWQYTGVDDTLAKTNVRFNPTNGAIDDADIEINSANHPLTTKVAGAQYDLQSIVTHEVGHFIGLAHSPNVDAVMFRAYDVGTIRRTLTPDDVAAICAVYPPERVAPCDLTPRGGFGPTCDGPAAGSKGCGCRVVATRALWPQMSSVLAIVSLVCGAIVSRRRRQRGRE